jgi:DNA-binding XRE family transcriptional regulator
MGYCNFSHGAYNNPTGNYGQHTQRGVVTARVCSEVFIMNRKRRKLPVYQFPLRDILVRKGISQAELARRTGLPEVTITAYCNRPFNPQWKTVLRIVQALGLKTGDLRHGTTEAEEEPTARNGKVGAA